MKLEIEDMDDEFEQYFKRAKEEEKTFNQNIRRGSLPVPELLIPDTLNIGEYTNGGIRRTASCKYPGVKGQKPIRSKPSSRKGSASNSRNRLCDEYINTNDSSLKVPSPTRELHSPTHSRHGSRRGSRRGSYREDLDQEPRPKNLGIPLEENVTAQLERMKALQTDDLCPARSFTTTSKGIVNRGDSYKRKSITPDALGVEDIQQLEYLQLRNNEANKNVGNNRSPKKYTHEIPTYKAIVIGDHGVGKTSLVQQFITSTYMGATTGMDQDDEIHDNTPIAIGVTVDKEEMIINFIVVPIEENYRIHGEADAYLVVYSVSDNASFHRALIRLHDVQRDIEQPHAVILVANKSDVVRGRTIAEEDGRASCYSTGAKYIEVSAVLNHCVDELLVGIVKQIRLNVKRLDKKGLKKPEHRDGALSKSVKGFFDKIFKKTVSVSRNIDNFQVL